MIPKPGKPPHEPTSYRPISLLPITSKLFERLFLKRISKEHDLSTLLPSHQFGFRERHSTIHQVHRIVNEIVTSLEEKKYCNTVFLDISQAFDLIWHPGLLYKLKHKLTSNYYLLLKSTLRIETSQFVTTSYLTITQLKQEYHREVSLDHYCS